MKKALTAVTTILLIVGYWLLENVDLEKVRSRLGVDAPGSTATSRKVGSYDRLDGCIWVDHRNNDGDSFHIRHGDGQYEFRLYFVDAPESKVKHYGNGENNLERIGHQGRYFDGLSVEDTTAVGSEAKKFTQSLLKGRPFTIYTRWQLVHKDDTRYFGLVEVDDAAGRARLLSEMLVEQGLARIYTIGADLPDGTSKSEQETKLRSHERSAKNGKVGAWRF